MNTIRMPTIFTQQITYIDNYFRTEVDNIDNKYNSMFNVVSSERMQPSNERNKTCAQILMQYPSLYRQYRDEFSSYQALYRKHRHYFHNKIFEELMKTVWHPRNYDKFSSWDPPSDDEIGF